MNVILKKATPEDLAILNKISFISKSYWNYPTEWMEKWRAGLLLKESDFITFQINKLELENATIGFSAIKEEELHYEIEHLWIHPNYIGKGYGKFLLHETILKVVIKNKDIILDADPNAEAFYRSQGFVTIGQKESYPKGRFLPIMKRKALEE